MPASKDVQSSDQPLSTTVQAMKAMHIVAMSVLAALLMVFSAPPFHIWPLTFASIGPLVWIACSARAGWKTIALVWLVFIGMWLWVNDWVMGVTTFGYPLMSGYLAIYPPIFVWMLGAIRRRGWGRRLPLAVVVPVLWVGLEFLRGRVVMTGYPWMLIGHPLIEVPALVQSASVFGAYWISFLVAMAVGMVSDVVANARIEGRQPSGVLRWGAFGLGACAWIMHVVYGVGVLRDEAEESDVPFRVLSVQTNLPQDNKVGWTREQQKVDVPEFYRLTEEGVANASGAVDLIVWPETMLPGAGFEEETMQMTVSLEATPGQFGGLYEWSVELFKWVVARKIPVLVGSEAWTDATIEEMEDGGARLSVGRRLNSAYLIDATGGAPFQRADKMILTPFGETIPYLSAWPWLESKVVSVGASGMQFNLESGDAEQDPIIWRGEGGRSVSIGVPICFEEFRGDVIRAMVFDSGGERRVDVLLSLSNDGWFGTSDSTRAIHAQIARFRCIESRTPMVRCVNTGYSIGIDAFGRIDARLDGDSRYGAARASGSILASVNTFGRMSVYGRVGDIWPIACCVLMIGLAGGAGVTGRRTGANARPGDRSDDAAAG